MSSYVFSFDCHCRQQVDSHNKERIITESCGHSKCRNCFIKEESGCVKCLSSKTCFETTADQSTVNNLIQNKDIIQKAHVSLINKVDTVSGVKGVKSSKPKDIRVLEQVIIKPFVEIPSNDSDGFSLPRIKEFPKFKYPAHISWHTVNGETEFECKICKKTFRSKSNRQYHFYCDRTLKKPFRCSKCTKTFATKNHLKYHENRHNNIKHFCKECDRVFLSRVSLQKHVKTHTDDFKYICDHCDMKFYNKSELILHMYNHKKMPLPFQCDTCDKKFSAKFKLNQHFETHNGVKAHSCQFCDKKFSRNSTLTMHLLTHSSLQTKYECKLCSKTFERQRSYDRHIKIKHGSTAYQCPLCDVQSGRKDNILRHIRNLHSVEKFDEIIKKITKNVARQKVPKPVENDSSELKLPVISEKRDEELNISETITDTAQTLTDTAQTLTNTAQTLTNVCQYQSVIKFAGRSTIPTPPPTKMPIPPNSVSPPPPLLQVPMDATKECSEQTSASATVFVNNDDSVHNNLPKPTKPYTNELRVELIEPAERDPKMSNISIYRQLLSPYLKPPPNLDFRNGSQEQQTYRGYQSQNDRLPLRKENVDIYRSILMSTNDDEHQTVICNSSNILHENEEPTNSKTESLVIHGQSSEYFSEMHWRKRTSQCFNQME